MQELRALLASCEELAARHRAELGQYLDTKGEVIEDKLYEYNDARITTAIEASDHLDAVRARLAGLLGPPAPSPFTLTFSGLERHMGEAPTSFVVSAMDLGDALRNLARLPSWREWYLAHGGTPDGQVADVVYLPHQSHPGLPALDAYNDMRGEQESATETGSKLIPRAHPPAVTAPAPPPAPASPAARTTH
ncbi:hypothetical protein EASAB2608_01070 [Streptomyces sp. EAS-AB2608]|uniref:hypothetical protein n=1 Tax=Streptomyces sp. EAS-AB2608 TaxID=2779671 RepID=UPI001BF122C4|nr:hypothetical protein [Streptomyces sp. EAS-AB2608]BCM65736.1 hypothetical protein EASAB2608_01070 [Streptomyces sp. EAS-AB2608]